MPSTEGNTAVYCTTANAQFRQLVHEIQDDGASVVLADMDSGTCAGALPILMIHQAIMSLQEVIDTAEKIDTENRKQQILLFLLALLSLIPIGGEVIAAINGLAGVGRFIALADEARIVDALMGAVKVNKAA
ncbi:hypothetical protein HAV15_010072 [Penicillium sp. str. |nr:hypothetical protein HAV15_010072 [Penicillium sp. str. \